MAARRHMAMYGTTSEQLGAIAVAERAWATHEPDRPDPRRRSTLEDYQASRWVAEPLHLLDCCLVSNGAVAVIVTARGARRRTCTQPPAYVWGMGQGHPGDPRRAGDDARPRPAPRSPPRRRSRWPASAADDIDVCELYDCYTYTVLVTLEDYGFCAKGEGGPFVDDGKLGPGGALPTNTGGGEL